MVTNTFIRFAAVGALGFCVDAAIFFSLVHGIDVPWALARVLAFSAAVGVTWIGNRHLTFDSCGPPMRESARYFAVQSAGCLVNYLCFLAAVKLLDADHALVAPYLLGTAAGTAFNYSLSRWFVFTLHQ